MLVPAVAAPQATATQVVLQCGSTVVGNVKLAADVGPCTDDGLKMASNAVLDLNGFRIIGVTAGSAEAGLGLPNIDDAGILFNKVSNAKVTDTTAKLVDGKWISTNGIIGFDAGVAIINASKNNTVEKVNIAGSAGFDGDYGEGIHVRDSGDSAKPPKYGNRIIGNNVTGSGPYGGITLIDNSDGNVVEGNTVAGNDVYLDFGIRLEASAADKACPDYNTVSNNTVGANTIDGITILNGKACDTIGTLVSGNKVTGQARDGIRLNGRYFPDLLACRGAFNTTVSGNTSSGNGGAGIKVTNCVRGSAISGNTVLGNNPDVAGTVGSPVLPPHGDLHDNNVNCGTNTWSNNVHVTEFAQAGSATAVLPTDFVCLK